MRIFNTNHLTGTVLAALACASFVGCSRANDRSDAMMDTSSTTTSNTTIAADDSAPPTMDNTGEVPPADATDVAPPAETTAASSTTSETKTTKHSKMKHRAKAKAKKRAHRKAHKAAMEPIPSDPVVQNEDDFYFDDSDFDTTSGSTSSYDDSDSMDASDQYCQQCSDTISGTTRAPFMYRETGLSPFAQEPNSRIPSQIGSGQLTGEDKSTTVLEGPSLFQDPSALGRDLIQ